MGHRSNLPFGSEPEYTRSELDALVDTPLTSPDGPLVDELLDWIEDGDASVRFVPDWSDESYKNAA